MFKRRSVPCNCLVICVIMSYFFQQENVLILSVSNLILRFIVGNPSWSCSKAFPPFRRHKSCTAALLVAWVTSICSSNQRQLLHVKGAWTTEQSIKTDLRLNARDSAFSTGPLEHVQTDLLRYKMLQWFKASVRLSFSPFFLLEMKQDRRQTGDNLSNICCLSLVSWLRTISF